MKKGNNFFVDFSRGIFAFALISAASFAHAGYVTLEPIVIEDKWINPQPGAGGGGGGGTGFAGGKPPPMTEEQREAYEEARTKERIRQIRCEGAQAAYNQASCQAKAQDPSGVAGAVESAVSNFSYGYLFAASVQNFARSLWQPTPGTTLRMLIGSSVREGASTCELAGKPVPTCVNQVLIFYGINSEWVPLGEINGVDVNDYVNRMFDGLRDPNTSPAASLIRQFGDGGFCALVRAIATQNSCPVK